MPFLEVLGWVAATLGMAAAVPQLVRLWRSRTSAGLSMLLWQLNVGGGLAWTLHGFHVGRLQLQVPNIVCTILFTGVLWFIVADRGLRLLPRLVLPVILAAGLFGLDLWLGPVAFGIVVAVPLMFGQLAQLKYMWDARDLSGVSVPTLVVNVVMQSLWLVWGLGVGEAAITVCAALMTVLCAANLGYYAWRRMAGTAVVPGETGAVGVGGLA